MHQGIATELIHVGQSVTAVGPGYYRRALDTDTVAGLATDCVDLGQPITVEPK